MKLLQLRQSFKNKVVHSSQHVKSVKALINLMCATLLRNGQLYFLIKNSFKSLILPTGNCDLSVL